MATTEENRMVQILLRALDNLEELYDFYERVSDADPTMRLYRETETLILKAIKKIDPDESRDKIFD